MSKVRWLYGASVQGIQKYIFQTNDLKDIIGASELVNKICSEEKFQAVFKDEQGELYQAAAGNIRYLFDSKEACEKAVRLFPKYAIKSAPGIVVSQAVVQVSGENCSSDDFEELEERLHSQRNKPVKSMTMGCMGMRRAPKTGLPAVGRDKDELLDECTLRKRETVKDEDVNSALAEKLMGREVTYRDLHLDTDKMNDKNDWVAVIHADGNGLGEVVAHLSPEERRDFSKKLDEATLLAAQKAYKSVSDDIVSIRPIVIGGDDLTVICRADIAVDFVKSYLDAFETETKNKLGETHKLTACAGIAFIKSSYPFYYGYELAETLCGLAKKDAKSEAMKEKNKGLAPSCLMFHKVQSSFVEDYEAIQKKELTLKDGTLLNFGPYYLSSQENRWTIEKLCGIVDELSKDENGPIKTSVRKWLTLNHDNTDASKQLEARFKMINKQNKIDLYEDALKCKERNGYCPAYDILSLVTIKYQETQKDIRKHEEDRIQD